MPSKLPWSKSSNKPPQASSAGGNNQPGASVPSEQQSAPSPQRNRLPDSRQLRQRPLQPERSASRRHSAHLLVERPPTESDFAAHDADPPQYPPQPHHAHHRSHHVPRYSTDLPKNQSSGEKRSFRSRLGFGSSSKESDHTQHQPQPQQTSPNKPGGVGRSVSLRKKEPPLAARYGNRLGGDQRRPVSVYWEQQGSARQLVEEPHEEDDDDQYDPYLIRDDKTSPSLPTETSSPASGALPDPHQVQYSQTPLSRANTDHSYHTASGSEHFYQDQDPFQSPQGSHHQTYTSPTHLTSPSQDQTYQAFRPGSSQGSSVPSRSQESFQRQPYQFQPKDVQHLQHPHHQTQPQQDLHLYPTRSSSRQPEPRTSSEAQRHPQTIRAVPQSLQQQDLHYHLRTGRPSSRQDETPPVSRGSLTAQPIDPQLAQRPVSREEGVPVHSPPSMPPMNKIPRDPRGEGRNMVSREISSLSLQGPQQDVGQGPPTPGMGGFGNGAQAGNQAQRRVAQTENEHGRGTPPPGQAASDLSEDDVRSLMKDHKELREKYTKVKKYYFEKEAQVHALQNTLAHERLSKSHTSLDDSEYVARFTRLDGLISQLAFSIRKSWKVIPQWLHPSVNKDAVQTGKQEMTAVGRAFISCWLVDELFDKYFHPDLETGLSVQLKSIQHNIRRYAPAAAQTGEEEEALNAKIITWRLATIEGLTDVLRAPQAAENRQKLMETTHRNLVNALAAHQTDPTPPDLEGGVYMIAELAVNIAVHLPLESRDVAITYFGPFHPVLADCMKVETGIPALQHPIATPSEIANDEEGDEDEGVGHEEGREPSAEEKANADRRGIFGNFMQPPVNKRGAPPGQGKNTSQVSLPQGSQQGSSGKEESQRVRLAVCVAVGIRGRSVLVKAPVFAQ